MEFVEGESNDSSLKPQMEKPNEFMCRLCAQVSNYTNPNRPMGWVSLTQSMEESHHGTICELIKKCIPKDLMFNAPEDVAPRFICLQCFQHLKQLLDFFEKIREGQKLLKNRLNIVPKRRGRPKKTTQKEVDVTNHDPPPVQENPEPSITNENEDTEGSRRRRPTRVPVRYTHIPETPKKRRKSLKEGKTMEAGDTNAKETEAVGLGPKEVWDSATPLETPSSPPVTLEEEDNEDIDNNDQDELKDPTIKMGNINARKLTNFQRKYRRKRGRPKYRGPVQYKCPDNSCDSIFNNYTSLIYHKVTKHTTKIDLECEICRRTFDEKSGLIQHMLIHSAKKLFYCSKCDNSFPTKSELIRHQKSKHTSNSTMKPFMCYQCGVSFESADLLNVHEGTHLRIVTNPGSKTPGHVCPTCGKEFTRRGNLQEHLRSHTKEKPFMCAVLGCEKRFVTWSQLNVHRHFHKGTKPYQCTQCDRSFMGHAAFKCHLKRHTGEGGKKQCPLCEKRFIEGASLKRHLRVHSGEKPYQCRICGRSFSDRSNLTKHEKRHRGNSPPRTIVSEKDSKVKKSTTNHSQAPCLSSIGVSHSDSLPNKAIDSKPGLASLDSPSLFNEEMDVPPAPEGQVFNVLGNLPLEENEVLCSNEALIQLLQHDPLVGVDENPTSLDEGNVIYIYSIQPNELEFLPVSEDLTPTVTATETGESTVENPFQLEGNEVLDLPNILEEDENLIFNPLGGD